MRGSTSTKWFFVYLIPGRIGIWKCWFLGRGENRSTRRKTSRSKGENQQQIKLNPHMASTQGFEPGPHWWEASALTNAPSLAPHISFLVPYSSSVLMGGAGFPFSRTLYKMNRPSKHCDSRPSQWGELFAPGYGLQKKLIVLSFIQTVSGLKIWSPLQCKVPVFIFLFLRMQRDVLSSRYS